MLRYALDGWAGERTGGGFPWGTLAVTVLEAFAVGVIIALTVERLAVDPAWRVALGIGFLGAFTTLSAFAYEGVRLVEDGASGRAILYIAGMPVLGLGAAAAGLAAGRAP